MGLFLLLPALSPWVGIPLCVVAFTLASLVLRLVSRREILLLLDIIRTRSGSRGPVAATGA